MVDQRPALSDIAPALVDEATRKAGLVWLTYGVAERARPAWHIWLDGAAYVVSGGEEQSLPEIELATEVVVTVPSKDTHGRLVSWVAAADRVWPTDPRWPTAAGALAAARLNARDTGHQLERWATSSIVTALTPSGQVVGDIDTPDDSSHRAPPPATQATTLGRQPFMVRGVRRSDRPGGSSRISGS